MTERSICRELDAVVIFLPESEGNLVCCKAIGKLTDEDLYNLTIRIERVLENHSLFSLYVNLEFFEGWEWQAAWDKNVYAKKYWDQIEKIAFVGNQKWEQTINKIAQNLKNGDKRYFLIAHQSTAIEWINK